MIFDFDEEEDDAAEGKKQRNDGVYSIEMMVCIGMMVCIQCVFILYNNPHKL